MTIIEDRLLEIVKEVQLETLNRYRWRLFSPTNNYIFSTTQSFIPTENTILTINDRKYKVKSISYNVDQDHQDYSYNKLTIKPVSVDVRVVDV